MTDMQAINVFLVEDLQREYQHWHFYMNAAFAVDGPRHEELKKFFLKEAADEMEHILQFGELLTTTCDFATAVTYNVEKNLENIQVVGPQGLLHKTIQIEEEAAKAYSTQLKYLEGINDEEVEHHIRYLKLFLEAQMQDSYQTALTVRKML